MNIVKAYRVDIGGPIEALVLEYENNFYSFGCTCRSSQSVWNEVKGRVHELEKCNSMKDEIIKHFYEEFTS